MLINGQSVAKQDVVFQSLFNPPNGPASCVVRHYNPKHMKSHQRQRVETIYVDANPAHIDDKAENSSVSFKVTLGLRPKTSSEWSSAIAYCSPKQGTTRCLLEGDGGGFDLSLSGVNKVKLKAKDISIEGESTSFEFGRKGDDESIFILSAAYADDCQKT